MYIREKTSWHPLTFFRFVIWLLEEWKPSEIPWFFKWKEKCLNIQRRRRKNSSGRLHRILCKIFRSFTHKTARSFVNRSFFQRRTHNNVSVFKKYQTFLDLSRKSAGRNSNIYHNLRLHRNDDIIQLHRQIATYEKPIKEFRNYAFYLWFGKYQSVIFGLEKDPPNVFID